MRRLGYRTAVALAVSALLAATFALGAAAAAPTALTGPVSAVGGTTATLTGTVNPGGAATDWWFEYGTSTSYGSKTATTTIGTGSSNIAVNASLSGLSAATPYHYRLVAKNVSGTSNGADGVFTTASPPVVVTTAATGVGPTTATLGGTVNPNGQATTWFVEYGTSTSYGSKTATANAGSGTSSTAVSVPITGLTAGRTYHFRLVATSSAGTTNGGDVTFVTAQPPSVSTSAPSSVTATGARLNGSVDPNGRTTTYLFEYGTTTSYGSKTSSSSAGAGTSAVSVFKTVSGLKGGTTYHFRIVATSDAGSVTGADRTFTTLSPPVVTTGPADTIGATSARLSASVNPVGRSTTWYFEYGTSTSYGSRTASTSAGSGTSTLTVYATPTNLKAGVTYHYRVVATNNVGTSRGADATLTTTGAPAVATGPVTFTSLSLTSAEVNGTLDPHGLQTTWWFEFGRTRAYGFRTPETQTPVGSATVRVSSLLQSLTPGTRWHYRLVARSSAGTSTGADASFATPPRPLDANGRPVRCTIVGTQGADVIRGTTRRDVICGLGGNDTILGRGGDDAIYGGPGADVINGGLGHDRVFGGGSSDRIHVRDGRRDVVAGGPGNDLAIVDQRLDRLTSVERRRTH